MSAVCSRFETRKERRGSPGVFSRRRRKKKINIPKTVMPVSPIDILCHEEVGYFEPGDDSFITSAYCDRDQIQWLYFRRVARGLSDLDKVECEVCGGDLFVNEKRGSFVTSTWSPEVVGWLKLEESDQGAILNLALTESSFETLRDVLLADILSHDFSGSISTINLLQVGSASKRDLQAARSNISSSLKLIERLKPRLKPKKQRRLKSDDLSESPLRLPESLNEKELQKMKSFLKNPRADDFKRSTTRSLPNGSRNSKTSSTTLPTLRSSALSLFATWKPPAEALKLKRAKAGSAIARSLSGATLSSSLKRPECKKGT